MTEDPDDEECLRPFPMAFSNSSDKPHVLVYGTGKKVTVPPGKMVWVPPYTEGHWEDEELQ